MKDFINWHFYHRKYNPLRALGSFAASECNVTQIERLTGEPVNEIQTNREPERVVLFNQPVISKSTVHREEFDGVRDDRII